MAHWKLTPGDWCHVEFPADTERAKRFYGQVFNWQFEDIPGAAYTNVKTSEDGIEGGFGTLPSVTGSKAPVPKGVLAYLFAPDMDATLAAIERAGGEVLIPRTDVMGYGDYALFRDPDGNVVGLWRDPVMMGS
jgi:uncharacterized protein